MLNTLLQCWFGLTENIAYIFAARVQSCPKLLSILPKILTPYFKENMCMSSSQVPITVCLLHRSQSFLYQDPILRLLNWHYNVSVVVGYSIFTLGKLIFILKSAMLLFALKLFTIQSLLPVIVGLAPSVRCKENNFSRWLLKTETSNHLTEKWLPAHLWRETWTPQCRHPFPMTLDLFT
jgi:hypothetical protein